MYLSWPVNRFVTVFSAMLHAAMKGVDDRPAMCGVHVERRDSVLTIAATNGHWLLRWREVEGQTDEDGNVIDRTPFALTIPRRTLEGFLPALKKPLDLERVNLDGIGETCSLSTILDVKTHDFLRQPEAFPDIDVVIPRDVAPQLKAITLSSDLFVSVARAWNRAGGGSMYLQMAGDELSPVVITSPSIPELLAVVMPMRPAYENALDETPVADAGMAAPEKDDLTAEMFPDPADGSASDNGKASVDAEDVKKRLAAAEKKAKSSKVKKP